MWKAVRLRIFGRVQGVGYRAWLRWQATEHGVSGWVRNRRDGSVEALLCGPAEAVDSLIEACRRGPAPARVDDIEIKETDERQESGFRQLATV